MISTALLLLWSSGVAHAGDKDKDGLSNRKDKCPNEAEDMDGFEDEDGCPDPDNDGDGILDVDDTCPDEAEDKDGFEDEDGCPDPDNDGDGVLDADDKCPNEREDGDDGDGCTTVTAKLLMDDGWAPAVKALTELLAANLSDEGCNDAAEGAQRWFAEHDPEVLHAVFLARIARDPEAAQPELVQGVLAAQSKFWESAGSAFDLYCEKHVLWPTMRPKIDAVYADAAKAGKE